MLKSTALQHLRLAKDHIMPITASAVDGTGDYARVSFSFIDWTGDPRSISALVPAGVTAGQIQGVAEALGEYSHAVLWKVEVTQVYEGSSSKTGASDDGRASVYDNVVVLFRNPTTRQTQDMFVPAPVELLFIPATDSPNTDPTSDLAVLSSLWENMLGAAAYNPISARYTERREINQREKF